MTARTLTELRDRFAALPAPVVVFNKSHSGSRLLARLMAASGVFMGADRNASEDALPLLKLVQYFVEHYHPDASALWDETRPVDGALLGFVEGVFADHLRGHDGSQAWGWKLCETVYAMPLIAFLFPGARFVHLIRDGRDVAFSNHVAPVQPFWQKVFADPRVRFLGWTSDKARFFGRIDLCVVPSQVFDTLPTVVIEAFAHHVPVLGAPIGGIPEMVTPGRNGFVLPLGSGKRWPRRCAGSMFRRCGRWDRGSRRRVGCSTR